MNRPFLPNFLKKIDQNLLLHKPSTWSTRAHIVVFFSLLFMTILIAIGFVGLPDAKESSWNSTGVGVVSLICFIGLVFWIIFLLRFNVFKKYGLQKPFDGLKMFGLLFLSIFFIVLPTYVLPVVESILANRKYTSNEIVQDINFMNAAFIKLNYDKAPKKWQRDTIVEVNNNDSRILDKDGNYKNVVVNEVVIQDSISENEITYGYKLVPKINILNTISDFDSTYKINDSMYVLLIAPYLQMISSSPAEKHAIVKQKTNKNLMIEDILGHKAGEDTVLVQKQLHKLLKKYYSFYDYYTTEEYYEPVYPAKETYEERVNKLYHTYSVENGIRNITDKKYRWDLDNFDFYFRVIFYITLVLTLLAFIFRHSTPRSFFLSILAAIVLFILSVIFIVASHDEYEANIPSLFLFYYVVAAVISVTILGANTRKALQGIALNLAVFFLPYVPLAILALYTAVKRASLPYDEKYKYDPPMYLFLAAEIGGILILIILLEPVIKGLYRKWYALPED